MKNKRLPVVLVALFLSLALFMLSILLAHPSGARASASFSREAPQKNLAEISEATGLLASTLATSEACIYDTHYQLYLCPETSSGSLPPRSAAAAAQARQLLLGGTGLLLIPDSGNDRVMAFDPITGNLVDPDFIPTDSTNLFTPKNAILSAGGNSILVSDQVNDLVQEYDLDGNYIGIFAPAGGPNTAILDNILGIALRPNGNLLVTVTSNTNQDSVAEFDTAGNYLGNFIANGSGGMDGPFDIYQRTSDWLVTNINSNDVNRHDLSTGAFLNELAALSDFPQQLTEAANDNVLIGNFSGSQEGVIELAPDGTLINVYNPAAVGGNRGAYELPNGNILTTNGTGVYEIDRLNNVVDTKISGVSAQYIEFVLPVTGIILDKTVGTDGDACATTDEISVLAGSDVYYCYEVTNSSEVTLTLHDLVDSELGVLINNFPISLTPGASVFMTQSVVIVTDTVNVATWTAYNPGPTDVVSATDVATVTLILLPEIVVAPTSLSSEQLPDNQLTQTLTISNVGDADLSWTITENQQTNEGSLGCSGDLPWVTVSPANGTTAVGGSSDVVVTFDSTGAAAGVYTGTLCVNSDDPVTPLVTVPVTLTVLPEVFGVLLSAGAGSSASPGETVTYTVSITNTGNVADTFNLSLSGANWVSTISDSSVALGVGDSTVVEVVVTVPLTVTNGLTDTVTLTAVSESNASATDSADFTTTAVVPVENYTIFLPVVLKP